MSSSPISNSKTQSKIIQCQNCRQDILASKMFLHEGFCQRNNIFCEHCNKVFLKKDYKDHFNDKSNKKRKKSHKKEKKEKEIQKVNIIRSPIITKRKTSFEYIEMPMTEEYKINKPIIISENGQIISNANKNEFLLPIFGIKHIKNTTNNKDILQNNKMIINQKNVYKDNNIINISSYDIDLGKNMKNSASMINLNTYHNLNEDNEINNNNKQNNLEKDNSIHNILLDENLKNKINILNRSKSSLLNNIHLNQEKLFHEKVYSDDLEAHLNNIKIINDNTNNINNNSNNENNNDNDDENNNNNIIINNNIITYNSNKNINKIHNIYSSKEKSKYKYNNKINLDNIINDPLVNISKENNKTYFNPLRVSNKEEKKKFNIKLKKNIINNNKSFSKEPNDSHIFNKILNKPQNIPHNNKQSKICEFCNSKVEDLVAHYQHYHLKKNNQLLAPKKRDTALLNEILNEDNTDEMGIDENKKKILLREFKPNLDIISKENDNKKEFTSEKKKTFVKPEKIEKLTFNKIFEYNVKYEKKNSPEDNQYIAKTQLRNSTHRNFLQLNNENYNKNENKSLKDINSDQILSPEINTSNINNSEDCYNPLYHFLEARKQYNINLTDGIILPPNMDYLNFINAQRSSFDNNYNNKI